MREADIELCPGLNVLYGPNDLGKSTLGAAIRAVLLVQHSSSAAARYVEWDTDETPHVILTFQTEEQRIWQIEKTFGEGARGTSLFRSSRDGTTFTVDEKARAVDDRVRSLLGWGIAPPGGKGAPKGLPPSFLSTVLLGEQTDVIGILNQTIDADTDTSGRERLTAALKAFAQDPIFKRILDTAQARADEGFTGTGRKRTGQGSPRAVAADVVKHAREQLEQLEEQLGKYDAVMAEMERLHLRREMCRERLRDAKEAVDGAQARLADSIERSAIEERLAAARSQLAAHSLQAKRLAAREQELADLAAQATAAMTAAAEGETALAAAELALREAESGLGGLESDDARHERQLAADAVAAERQRLDAEAREVETEEETAENVLKADARVAAAAQEVIDHTRGTPALERQRAEEVCLRDAAAREIELLTIVERLARAEDAEAEIQRLETALGEAEADRIKAGEKRDAAAQFEPPKDPLPPAEVVDALVTLHAQLREAEAALGGGIHASIALVRPLHVRATVDAVEREGAASGDTAIELEAQRSLVVELPDIGRLTVTAGEAKARASFQALSDQWRRETEPVFRDACVGTLADLRRRVDDARSAAASAARLREEATNLEAQANIREGGAVGLSERRAELAMLTRELVHPDVDAARKLRDELRERPNLDARAREAHARRAAAVKEVEAIDVRLRELELHARALAERAASAAAARGGFPQTTPEGGWAAHLGRLREKAKAIKDKSDSVRAREAAVQADAEEALRRAREAVATARSRRDEAASDVGTVNERRAAVGIAHARLAGELGPLRAQHALLDLGADVDAVSRLDAELETHPPGEASITSEQVDALQEVHRAAVRAADEIEDELRKAEGALETLGGDVVREKVTQAREAMQLASKREVALEVEYESWQLLATTLREAETLEGQHLGESLSVPVTRRFAALTSGAYGKLELEPSLVAAGIQVAGTVRDVSSLSAGNKEQLATLLRLTIAEHLGSAIVLDDQLTQTDAARGTWFRRLLHEHAEKTQVVVCVHHPIVIAEITAS